MAARHDKPSAGRRRGLTLIEITVVLAVLAILATLAVPSFGDRLARQRLAHAAESLAMDLAEARHQAPQLGQTLYVTFSAGVNWCYAVATTPSCPCGVPQPCQLKVVQGADHPGVTLVDASNASFDAASVAPQSGGAEWKGVRGTQSMRVSMTPLGRSRICSPTGMTGYAGC
jgi:type IV fimbrial biogenesis protein FimT